MLLSEPEQGDARRSNALFEAVVYQPIAVYDGE